MFRTECSKYNGRLRSVTLRSDYSRHMLTSLSIGIRHLYARIFWKISRTTNGPCKYNDGSNVRFDLTLKLCFLWPVLGTYADPSV